MVSKKLWYFGAVFALSCGLAWLGLTDSLAARKKPTVGLTFEWTSVGSDIEINYIRTQGGRNERREGIFISKSSPMEFAYMPGDVNEIPAWMDVEWQYGIVDGSTYEEEHSHAKPAKAHFDLKALVPASAIEQVAKDPEKRQLKLIGTFNDNKLDLRYEVYQWRK